MNEKIDIVVNWLNGADDNWLVKYNNYVKSISTGDKSITRFREWDIFKFFLRSIEKNCPWFNQIVICVFDEHQIPSWLNVKNPKLKIIYHKDVMPSSVFPTYNGLAACSYLLMNGKFSNNFIYCNDDQFFIKPMQTTDFFRNNVCVKYCELEPRDLSPYFKLKDVWCSLMKNTVLYKERITGNPSHYYMRHLPSSFHKLDFEEFYKKYGKDIDAEYSKYNSKIRQASNIVVESVVDYIQLDKKDFIQDDTFKETTALIDLKDEPNWHEIFTAFSTKKMICLNDHVHTQNIEKFNDIKNKLHKILSAIFPEKSSFEV